jgi:peptidoglycan/xylan/chitin deacetylase (PgdA/CDA1 family)
MKKPTKQDNSIMHKGRRGFRTKRIAVFLLCLCLCLCLAVAIITASTPDGGRIPVFIYHHILSDSENHDKSNPYIVSTESFAGQMKYLHDNGYHTLTPVELLSFLYDQKELPPRSVFLHFDDGYASVIERAYPILKQYGFRATVFLISAEALLPQPPFDPGTISYISADSMAGTRDVFTYASHTHDLHHPNEYGNSAFMLASTSDILADLRLSFAVVDDPTAFAYPLGQYSGEKAEALSAAGVRMAFTTNMGYAEMGSDPLQLDRIGVFNNSSLGMFKEYAKASPIARIAFWLKRSLSRS